MLVKSRHWFWFLVLLSCAFISSCEKEIKLAVEDQPAKVVVDARIENDQPPVVVLSNSLKYFSKINPEELAASFIHDADITVSNGSLTHKLREYSQTDDSSGYIVYFYTVDSSDLSTAFVGRFNSSYQLHITTPDGKKYQAETRITSVKKTCDSLWWMEPPENVKDRTLAVVMGRFTDPKGYGDYVRAMTSVNSEPFYTPYTSVFDDLVTDGTTYNFRVDKSYSRNEERPDITGDDYGFYKRGDTVTLKLCNLDKTTFDFWRTWEYSWQATGNPFSSPIKVLGNVSNNALGAFYGYAAQYRTIIIPK
ncbi:DUF4249 domain-containing protein [Foetidibacter luteolus]|uniref:DUF4249 domain-containing protein n=1 Tax=Foetidibacter luteolus TaxID=2608880 RepID=UPI00129A7A92|nr:DUF4249 domain-containing protein [Foetidibacter luteolus]